MFLKRFVLGPLSGAMICLFTTSSWAADLAEIKARGEIRHIGIRYANFVTGAGDGLDVELMQGFAKRIGVNYKLVYSDFYSVIRDLLGKDVVRKNGEVTLTGDYPIKGDVISTGFTMLPWREAILLYSDPVLPSQVLLVAPAESELQPIEDGADLAADIAKTRKEIGSKSVLVMERTCLDPTNYGLDNVGLDLKRYNKSANLNEMVPAMLNKEAELTLLDVPDAILDLRKWAGRIKILGPISGEQMLATAFPKDAPMLRAEFNAYLRDLKASGAYDRLVDKYYPGIRRFFPEFFAKDWLMKSSLIRFSRSVAPHWLSIAAGAFLLSMFFLIGNLYSSQVELRQNADARLVSIGEARAAEIGDFLVERRQAAARLAGSEDIANYFSNLDLGMSVKYGLFANLAAIERRFQATKDDEKYQGQLAYLRLAFFDRDGTAQVDVGAPNAPEPLLTGNPAEPSIQIDEKRRLIVASAPVLQKGQVRGTVQTVSSLNLLASLVSANDLGQPHEFLLGDDGEILLPIERERSPIVAQGRALAAVQSGRIQALSNLDAPELKGYLALRSPIAGTRLSILRLASQDELYGNTLSPVSVFYIGLFAIILFAFAIGFERMRQNTARLQIKFIESNRHRTELAEHNLALSQEIKRREAIEIDLQRQSEALDKTNAELRIAAAAFNAQEGMIVTDTKGVILSANRAFVNLTRYTMEELVGQTARLFRAQRRDTDFYRSMWNSVQTTGGWQGDMSLRTKSGENCARWLTISAVKNEAGEVTNYIGSYYDISKLKHAEEKIRELAFFDQLTGLPNRVLLIDRVRQALNNNARNKSYGALLFIDLDNFKTLNDSLGHDMGDQLLKKAAQRILRCVRTEDTVARFGGDEFVVLLANLGTRKAKAAALQAEAIGEKILAAFVETFQLDPYEYPCTPSVGVTLFSPEDRNVDELLNAPISRCMTPKPRAETACGSSTLSCRP